jgi:outer membrane protein assembly factor BamB
LPTAVAAGKLRVVGSTTPQGLPAMRRSSPLRAILAGAATAGILGLALLASHSPGRPPVAEDRSATVWDAPPLLRDWPMRGGTPQRNMANLTARKIPATWDVRPGREKNIKWKAELGSKSYGSPVISGGKVFIGTNNDHPRNPRDTDPATKQPIDRGILMCFEEATGKFLWQAVHDKLPSGRVNDWPREGIVSTPAVEGNRVYYVSNRCELVCADTEGFLDGKNDGAQDEQYKDKTDADIVWKLDMMDALGVFPHNLSVSSPLIIGDRVFVVTSNGVDEAHVNVPAPKAPSFLAVNKKTGRVAWSDRSPTENLLAAGANPAKLRESGGAVMHGQWSSPVCAVVHGWPQVIFPGGDGWLYAFQPTTGKLLWKFDANPKRAVYKLGGKGDRSDFIATPVVHENRLYIGLGQDPEHDCGVGHFWCIDVEKATRLGGDVSPKDDKFDPASPPNRNSALAWHYGGNIEAPREVDGRDYTFGRTLSSAAVVGGLVYVAEQEGFVHCLDARTGTHYWEHEMDAPTWCSPYYADGKVFIGNDKNRLLVFQHGREKKLLAQIDMKGKVRVTPVVANGVLYVVAEGTLYAIAARD